MKNSIYQKKFRLYDFLLQTGIFLSCAFTLGLISIMLIYIFVRAVPSFKFSYLLHGTSSLKGTVGLLPNIINTLYMIVLTLLIVCPIGIGSAIYLNEYAKNKKFVKLIYFTTEVLSGIPSIIYGLFGSLFFGGFFGYSILTGALTLALMNLPTISKNSITALQSVPKSYREASLGLGATKWFMIRTALLPSATPGILTGVILTIGRIVAESAVLLFTAGASAILPKNFVSHIFNSGATLTVQLYFEIKNGNFDYAFSIAMVLMIIILILNAIAKSLSKKMNVEGR